MKLICRIYTYSNNNWIKKICTILYLLNWLFHWVTYVICYMLCMGPIKSTSWCNSGWWYKVELQVLYWLMLDGLASECLGCVNSVKSFVFIMISSLQYTLYSIQYMYIRTDKNIHYKHSSSPHTFLIISSYTFFCLSFNYFD